MSNVQTSNLPQLPAAVTVEASVGIFGAPCIRVGILPQLATREELTENKELIYWLVSTSLMREQQKLAADFQRDHTAQYRRIDGRMVGLGISLFTSMVGDCEVSIQVDVPGVSTTHLRRSFDHAFNTALEQVEAVRPYAMSQHRGIHDD